MSKILSLLITILVLMTPCLAFSKPIAVLEDEAGTVVTAYDDKCAFPSKIANLPYKVTWQTKGKKLMEGCGGGSSWAPIVVLYFPSDKTVVVLPLSGFKKLTDL